jgi:hypothetical protein
MKNKNQVELFLKQVGDNIRKERLKKGIAIVTEKVEDDTTTLHINEAILNKNVN